MTVSERDIEDRYHRQRAFAPLGDTGQRRLAASHAVIVGCGALGSVVASLLVRSGIGKVTLIDPDFVSLDNLHRQILFTEMDAVQRRYKVDAARDALRAANHEVEIDVVRASYDSANADEFTAPATLLFDGCDNVATRHVMNRAAYNYRKPFISGGVTGMQGQVVTVIPPHTPCLECLFAGTECNEILSVPQIDLVGILSPVVMLVASLQVSEALHIIAGDSPDTIPFLQTVHLWDRRFKVWYPPATRCAICQ